MPKNKTLKHIAAIIDNLIFPSSANTARKMREAIAIQFADHLKSAFPNFKYDYFVEQSTRNPADYSICSISSSSTTSQQSSGLSS